MRRLEWFVALNNRISPTKRLHDASQPEDLQPKPVAMLGNVQEIAIYLHRFHNLDLFQQGWYQIKITMRWEDDDASTGYPARVVQYEVPPFCSDDVYGGWKIDDTDNSFSTQPFRIKYARQDVFLSIMISFNLSLGKYEGQSSSAVILKFELMFAPISANEPKLHASLDSFPVAVHEFRVPPKALLGMHSYCPVHFDALHAVLVDTSIHASILKASSRLFPRKLSHLNDFCAFEDATGDIKEANQVVLIKSLLTARDKLLEDLQKLSKEIHQVVDLTGFTTNTGDLKFESFVQSKNNNTNGEVSGFSKQNNAIERANGPVDWQSDQLLHSLSGDNLVNCFNSIGDQVICLWNSFLNFHRANKTKILEFLRDAWAVDRRAEWSIWMVYSKVEMPQHYIISGVDESHYGDYNKRASSLWNLLDNPSQAAAMRAELHRKSIAQMRINNLAIQDMHIFGDPSHIPVVIVERIVNARQCTTSERSCFSHWDTEDSPSLLSQANVEGVPIISGVSQKQCTRVLKIAVFVHGFQGHHLDLRLVRNQWLLIDPKIEFLMSEVNEDKTYDDFREMGLRLAQEVISFVKKKMDKVSKTGILTDIKLSFVGHSIGNVIIRAALADSIMEPYLRYLYTYISISGPHLGYLYSSNSLFNSGLWLLKKLKGTQCIHQLTFTDDPELHNTFFYQLSKHKTLESFRHIILLSSPQDGYVPYHSARIEFCHAASNDNSKKAKVFLDMLSDCLDQIQAPSPYSEHNRVFMRCDVNFDTSSYGKNLNSFIGRAAHIEFLESDIFARFIMWSFQELFH